MLRGKLRAAVLGGIGRICPQREDGDKGRGRLRVGGNVMNRRDLLCRPPPLPGDAHDNEPDDQSNQGEGEPSSGATRPGQDHAEQ